MYNSRMSSALRSLSPLDGRYREALAALREYFSEFAFLRARARAELEYLLALSEAGVVRPLSEAEAAALRDLAENFTEADAEKIQQYERETRHDVKAIEYFLRDQLRERGRLPALQNLNELPPWLHFGLTSEDVNNLAQARALKESRDAVLLPALDSLLNALRQLARQYRALPMLARTHGQPAVPTTLGKEFAVYYARLKKTRDEIARWRFEAKLCGAAGNFNAMQAAFPQTDWLAFSRAFIQSCGLQPNLAVTQTLPYENWLRYFDLLRLANAILIDFAQDMWRYISDGWLKQAVLAGEVGSSTMPQKVNPIDFENAEGNLGIANALFAHYAQKLPVSRLQRDLSDSTVRRTFGVALGHALLAWQNLRRGLARVAADEEKLRAELDAHWETVAEGAQTILRAAGKSDAYETLKERTRGKTLTGEEYRAWADSLDVQEETRARLKSLAPHTYIGLAVELVETILAEE